MLSATYNGHPVHLIESLSEFDYIKSLINPKVTSGVDTETTGLTWFKDKVVGICVSAGQSYNKPDYHGFYLPIRHVNYENNLPVKETIEFIQWLVNNQKTAWWNRAFDFQMLEQDGFKAPCVGHTHEVQAMAHLILGEHMPALKPYAAQYLKYEVIEFSSNKAEAGNFGTTDPRTSFIYGSQDPIVTALLGRQIWAQFPYIQKIYPLDNLTAEVMRRFMRDTEIPLDKEAVKTLLDKTNARMAQVKAEIFSITGYQFRLTSNRDKADALSRFVTLTKKTKGGQFAVSEEVLAEIDHPLAKLLVEYAGLEKLRGSYLQKFFDFPDKIHVAYQTCNVPTGRFSSGASKGNEFFQPLNIQNIPKQEEYLYLVPDETIGWRAEKSPEGAVGKVKCKTSLRDCFVPPEGYLWTAFDYSAEEVCLCKDTMVSTPNGQIPIQNLNVGDKVNTPFGVRGITATSISSPKEVYEVEFNGHIIKCSNNHRFAVVRGSHLLWIRADSLRCYDYLFVKSEMIASFYIFIKNLIIWNFRKLGRCLLKKSRSLQTIFMKSMSNKEGATP